MNILKIIKGIKNFSKLDRELNAHTLVGPIYSGLTAKGNEIDISFSANLTQAQIDAVTLHVNNFIEVSVADEIFEITSKKQIEGWEIYKRIISDINEGGGIAGYLDTNILPAFEMLTPLRNMLKDGFFEFALRHFSTEIATLKVFSEEKETLYSTWIKNAALKFGGDDTILTYMTVVPKGQFPFGPAGAP
jgi:hypothetical protein